MAKQQETPGRGQHNLLGLLGEIADNSQRLMRAIADRHCATGGVAPPDPLNTAGQSWGLAGFNAVGLELESFAPYRDMLRASMRHAGAIRLDHVLGLKRLYLVPQGFTARDGVYVQMPFEALLAVTAQESVANRCVVIGEDLGTVPEGRVATFRDSGPAGSMYGARVTRAA